MGIPETAVYWAGATPHGSTLNPVTIVTSPLIAAQLALLAETEEFSAAAEEHPKAYAGLQDLLAKITAAFQHDIATNSAHYHVSPKTAAEEGFHADLVSSALTLPEDFFLRTPMRWHEEPGTGIHQTIIDYHNAAPLPPGFVPLTADQTVKYVPGRASVPQPRTEGQS